MQKYQIIQQVDNGSYSVVYRAKDLTDNSTVAIKRMKKRIVQSQKLQLRQLKILETIRNPCITSLKEWFVEDDGVLNFVFNCMPQNLLNLYTRLAHKRQRHFSQRQVKCVIFQCLIGLSYLHDSNIIHRDIKPENILIDKYSKHVKITDFGLSKLLNSAQMTLYVSTRWYRAPQLLLKSPDYSKPADIFALGCIMCQLLRSKQMFDGSDTFDQLDKIFRILGTPTNEEWPQFRMLCNKLGMDMPIYQAVPLQQIFSGISKQGIEVLSSMLRKNPKHRARAKDIVQKPYFFQIYAQVPEDVIQYLQKHVLSQHRPSHTAKPEERAYSSRFIQSQARKTPVQIGSLQNRSPYKYKSQGLKELQQNKSLRKNNSKGYLRTQEEYELGKSHRSKHHRVYDRLKQSNVKELQQSYGRFYPTSREVFISQSPRGRLHRQNKNASYHHKAYNGYHKF